MKDNITEIGDLAQNNSEIANTVLEKTKQINTASQSLESIIDHFKFR